MSELTVGTISGLAANNYVVDVAAGSQLTQPGMVLQVVQTNLDTYFGTNTVFELNDTIPQNTEGAEILTASITPSSNSSKILVRVVMHVTSDNTYISGIALFRDSVADAIASAWSRTVAVNNPVSPMTIDYLDSPGADSTITYKVRGGTVGPSSTFQINGGSGTRYLGGSLKSTITLMEIAQ